MNLTRRDLLIAELKAQSMIRAVMEKHQKNFAPPQPPQAPQAPMENENARTDTQTPEVPTDQPV